MKTLVIHPKDETTDFLKHIYKDKDWIVVNDNIPNSKLRKLIIEHDRIVMLGHGAEVGLFGFEKLIVGAGHVQFLREKECVGIWCNAKDFFDKYGLKGFCSGMFISDYMEANMYCVNSGTSEIDASNIEFAKIFGQHIFTEEVLWNTKRDYKPDNPVKYFNHHSLYHIT